MIYTILRPLTERKVYLYVFFKCNSLRSNWFMTRDTYQQFWYTGVVLISKLDHFFTVSVLIQKHF